jgi:hypothetical protein
VRQPGQQLLQLLLLLLLLLLGHLFIISPHLLT